MRISDYPSQNNKMLLTGRQIRRASTQIRVLAGRALCNGGAEVSGLSARQAAGFVHVDRGLINAANRATPEQIEAVERGVAPLSSLRNAAPSDAAIRRYVERVGLARIVDVVDPDAALALLDRLTAPATPIAAE
jgi:hypothetical protein